MKLTHLLSALALSSMLAPVAMAKPAAIRLKSAHVKVHVTKKASTKRAKRGIAKNSRRRAKVSKRSQRIGRQGQARPQGPKQRMPMQPNVAG